MEQTKDLTNQNIRMLAAKLSELTKTRLKHYLDDSGAIIYYNNIRATNKDDRLLKTLQEGNGSEEIRRFLSTIISEEFSYDELSFFEQALDGSRFIVEHDPAGGIKVLVNHSNILDEQVPTHRSYLEEYAPEKTLRELDDAREELAEGDYSTSLYKCRMALDSMTSTGFGKALDQLESEGYIEQIDVQQESPYTNKVREYRFIYSAWSWTSWLGSHTSKTGPIVEKHQAEVGIVLTTEVLYYLVRILKNAPSGSLDRWVEI